MREKGRDREKEERERVCNTCLSSDGGRKGVCECVCVQGFIYYIMRESVTGVSSDASQVR